MKEPEPEQPEQPEPKQPEPEPELTVILLPINVSAYATSKYLLTKPKKLHNIL